MTAKVGLKLRAGKPNKHAKPSYDFSRPQEPGTRNAFVLQLRNMFQASSNIDERDNEEVDTANQQCKHVMNLSAGCRRLEKSKELITHTRHVEGFLK